MVNLKDVNFLVDFGNALEGSGIYSSATRLAKGLTEYNYNVKINSRKASAIVHVHTALPFSYIKVKRILKQRKGNIPILFIHGHTTIEDFVNSFFLSNQIKFVLKHYLPAYYKLFDKVIAVSQHNKQLLMNYGIPENKLTVISNGIKLKSPVLHPKLRSASRSHLGLKEGDKLIICIGICIYRKGIDRFIDIAQRMPQYQFIWIGKRIQTPFIAHASYLKKKFKLAKKIKNCRFPGYVSYQTLLGLISASDIFVYPTREENQGIAFLEAALYNKPSVISRHPVFEEYKENVHVLKASTIEEFVTQIDTLAKDKNLASTLVTNTKEHLKIHDLEKSVTEIAKLYDSALQKRKQGI